VGKPIPLGVEETTSPDTEFLVYPNPCKDGILHLLWNNKAIPSAGGYNIRITNLLGQTMVSVKNTGDIDVSALRQGIYILYLTDPDGNKSAVKKIIITP